MSSFKNRLVVAAVLLYYVWAASVFNDFGPNGYYNYLTRGLSAGRLYVPIDVNPKLLTLPNPYDPEVPDELKMHDMVLYRGHYFLYHGIGPALLSFLPYRLVTGRDLAECVAVILFVSLAFLCNVLTLTKPTPLSILAIGLANSIPFLLHRVQVYEVAISCGYFCLAAGFCLYFRERFRWAGLFFGLAILARPHLGLALLFVSPRVWPTAAIGMLISGAYNFLRFGSPLEFGLRYLIAGPNQQEPHWNIANVLPSLWFFTVKPPSFPALEITATAPFALPGIFLHENMIGCLWLAPFILFHRPTRLTLFGLAMLLFLSTTGWVTQRYEVDFLPWLVLAAVRQTPSSAFLIYAGILVNLVLHWRGPYNAP